MGPIKPSPSGNRAAQEASERQSIAEVEKKSGRSPFGPGHKGHK